MNTTRGMAGIFWSIVLFIIFITPSVSLAAVEVRGNIHEDQTWNRFDGPYVISSTIRVFPDATLTILPGTEVVFTEMGRLVVNGRIEANGTAERHIVITADSAQADMFLKQLEVPVEQIDLETIKESESVGESIPDEVVIPEEIIEPETTVDEQVPIESEENEDMVPSIEPQEIIEDIATDQEVLGEEIVAEKVDTIISRAAAVNDRTILIAAGEGGQRARGQFNYVDISSIDYGIMYGANAEVSVDNSTFSSINYFPLYGLEGDMEVTNTIFTGSQYAGMIQRGSLVHENNTFNTDVPGWLYAPDLSVGKSHTISSTDGVYFIATPIERTSTLTIEDGVSLYVPTMLGSSVQVEGNLIMNGTQENPITVYGDKACNNPTNENSIYFYRWWGYQNPVPPDPTVTLKHVNFKNLCNGISGTHGTLDMDHVTFDGMKEFAVEVQGTASIKMTNSEIENSGTGLVVSGFENAIISHNHFHDNETGVHAENIQLLDVRNNDWGSANGPTITENSSGDGDTIVTINVASVLYCPWIGREGSLACPGATGPGETEPEPPLDRDPVIIVPGIAGSELIKNYEDHTEAWPNLQKVINNLADSQLDDLSLLVAGEESPVRPMKVGDAVRLIKNKDVIQGLVTELISGGYTEGKDLFVLPYDWRLSNSGNAVKVQEKVQQALNVSGKTKVDMIAHSMGGLLVKEYIAQYDKTKIDQLFFIGTPHLGSPKAFKTLMYGDDMGFAKKFAGVELPLLSSNRIFQISQNMPSIYELLPSEEYVSTVGPYVADLVRDYQSEENEEVLTFLNHAQTESYMDQKGRNNRFFENASVLHERAQGINYDGVRTYNFAACGATRTLDKVLIKRKRPTKIFGMQFGNEYELTYTSGDDTVPANSAKAIDADFMYYVKSSEHSTLLSDVSVRSAIKALLQDKVPVSSSTLGMSENNCGVAGKTISVHSPMELGIYGDNGHVGPMNGNRAEIEYGEENVAYDIINNEKFAFLPTGNPYTVVLKSEEVGVFDMTIAESNKDNTITTKRYYYNIPIAGMQTKAHININADGTSDYILHIDQDGDSMYESYRAPARVVNGLATADMTPPVTIATASAGVFTLTASDAETGVLQTLYSTDETNWHHYSDPVSVIADQSVEFFSVDNLGNAEEVQEIFVAAVVLPQEPIDPDPVDPENPTGPGHTDPHDPTGPADPHNPEDPVEPVDPHDPIDTENPGDTDPTSPTNPSNPGNNNDPDGDTDTDTDDQEGSSNGNSSGGSGNNNSNHPDEQEGQGTIIPPQYDPLLSEELVNDRAMTDESSDPSYAVVTSSDYLHQNDGGYEEISIPDEGEGENIEFPETDPASNGLLASAHEVVSTAPAIVITVVGISLFGIVFIRRKYKKKEYKKSGDMAI